jgi:SAM-dependent methyltransferase
MGTHQVTVRGIPGWVPAQQLLGSSWRETETGWTTQIERDQAADLLARLRNIAIGGSPVAVSVLPKLKRTAIRQGRLLEARRLRDTSIGFSKSGTRLDEEARFSLTPEELALELGRRLAPGSVLDACCGAGGNTIGFARAGCHVTAIEEHPGRLEMAKHNARLYGVEAQIQFIGGDGLQLISSHKADHLFVDPPWGDWDRQRCVLDDFPLLSGLVARWRAGERYGQLWAKLPSSFVPASMAGAVPEAIFGTEPGDQQRIKYLLLGLERP